MNYSGMNASTGRTLSDVEHLRQSVRDILFTPIGSRVMRREYGSLLPELIDQPINEALPLRLTSAAVMALLRWEPRLRLTSFQITLGAEPGSLVAELNATRTDGPQSGQSVRLSIPLKGSSI